ncbi:hypothetical protein J4E83_009304 [Alternaria metachromatica]|uniref:uncharacterized protein n=1 Tax=Alternaria metachromatica TaxID=283354 RepID=UPI0020C33420|nr:uncharacterized protein J4E83_009304 [Alternaria metachromatica]KAI4608121.1 hypothetical protein J4E83_009304 [Alternaria metachromatica]
MLAPTPPPLPPAPKPASKAINLKVSAPPSQPKHDRSTNSLQMPPDQTFRPCYMFLYGSLMDPEVLQAVLNLPELPTTRPATITGFRVRMWSIYPALILGDGDEKVSGVVWKVEEEDHFKRLQEYETYAYIWTWCEATLNDDETVLEKCRTFCWAGDPDSKELEDGSFDMARYQRVLKPSIVKKRPVVP